MRLQRSYVNARILWHRTQGDIEKMVAIWKKSRVSMDEFLARGIKFRDRLRFRASRIYTIESFVGAGGYEHSVLVPCSAAHAGPIPNYLSHAPRKIKFLQFALHVEGDRIAVW